jgi:hypothetical protein
MFETKDCNLLEGVLNELIPASADGQIPGGGDVGLVTSFLPVASRYDSDPDRVVQTVLAAIRVLAPDFLALPRESRLATLKAVEAQEFEAFARLVRLAYIGYYSRAELRPLFGVSARPVHPLGYNVPREDPDLIQSLTAPVRARGRTYRDADDTRGPGNDE